MVVKITEWDDAADNDAVAAVDVADALSGGGWDAVAGFVTPVVDGGVDSDDEAPATQDSIFNQSRLEMGPGAGIYLGKQELLSEKKTLKSTCSWHHASQLPQVERMLKKHTVRTADGRGDGWYGSHSTGLASQAGHQRPDTARIGVKHVVGPAATPGGDSALTPQPSPSHSARSMLFGSFNPDSSHYSAVSPHA